ncbi:MAG: DNA repair exonuclease [Zestosphaera sp.]
MLLTHVSDLHIGAFSNTSLFKAPLNAFGKIAEFALHEKTEYLVVAGDFFEKPEFRDFPTLLGVLKILRELKERGSVKVVVGPGSHDRSYRSVSTLEVLREAGLLHIPEHEETGEYLVLKPLEVGGVTFYALPGLNNNREVEYVRSGRVRLERLEEVKGPVVLIAHTNVRFEGYNPADYSNRYGELTLLPDDWFRRLRDKVNYIALGHVHFPVPVFHEGHHRMVYAGAPVGRDKADLRETLQLRRNGFNRRAVLVDLSDDPPRCRSIWDDFGVEIDEVDLDYKGLQELGEAIKSRVSTMRGIFKALLVELRGVNPVIRGRVLHELRVLELTLGTLIYTDIREVEVMLKSPIISSVVTRLSKDIQELKKEIALDIIKKYRLNTSVEKLLELLETLGEDDAPEKIYEKIKPILEEMVR